MRACLELCQDRATIYRRSGAVMPGREKIRFSGSQGAQLAALLEVPDKPARAHALFAHCFTCGKDIAAAARIARALTANGIAVMRFDFTGLGHSDGEFANTNFSSNVEDLVAAADHMRNLGAAPDLLVGHSLGGTAVLFAAGGIPEVRAVATIGAPASPEHVIAQFKARMDEIENTGEAEVELAGRRFRIRKQFLDDLQGHRLRDVVSRWKRALLVMHAPLDDVVSIEQAGVIFGAARHPKSFISLDGANHLLTRLADAQYVANTITSWAERYLPEAPTPEGRAVAGGEVSVGEANRRFLRDVTSDDHYWLADEPRRVGGENLGPDPYEHLLAALGTCTSMTLRMYANRKDWPLDDVTVRVRHSREHASDCEGCEDNPQKIEVLSREIEIHGQLDAAQRRRLIEIADRCPVHKTLSGMLRITTEEVEVPAPG